MIKEEDLDRILSRSKELEESMSTISGDNDEFVKISKEYSDLKPIVDNINIYNNYKKEHDELQSLVQGDDEEIVEMAKKEINPCKEKLIESENILKVSLVPKDPLDEKNVIVEIRAGTGGGKGTNMLYLSGVSDHKISNEDIVTKVVKLVEEKVAELND